MDNNIEYWNKIHHLYFHNNIETDNWLIPYTNIIMECKDEIIDLGCGIGNNTLFISNLKKTIVACDFSNVALDIINKNIKSNYVRTINMDMTKKFIFPDNYTNLIIADLSLHYFNEITTFAILNEIKRILKKDGYLLFRVNSTKDINYGALSGTEIEKNYYSVNDYNKRFFAKKDILYFFKDFEIISLEEETMYRYELPKVLWKSLVKNK